MEIFQECSSFYTCYGILKTADYLEGTFRRKRDGLGKEGKDMSTREKLLLLLDERRGQFVSGEEVAAKLSVSRGAIWKAVKSLQAEGYIIRAVTRKGYCLLGNTDVLSPLGIRQYLTGDAAALPVEVYSSVISTNRVVKERLVQGATGEFAVLAEQQTEGCGRKGRTFFSPARSGLYMSVLLRPEVSIQDSVLITAAAAVAVAETLEEVSGTVTRIKWVNDIFQRGKKVAGILTEAGMSLETRGLEYAVLGIGVNVFEPEGGFPAELTQAAAVFSREQEAGGLRGKIAAGILNRLVRMCHHFDDRSFLKPYRERSLVLGQNITVLQGEENRAALALELDEHCHLRVRYENGEEAVLSSEEISVRL